MSATANYAATPRSSSILVNTANADVTAATGSKPTVFTSGASGSRIDSVAIKGIVATGATQAADTVRLYLYNGVSYFLIKESLIAVGAGVISATVNNAEVIVALGIVVPTGYQLCATTHVGGATASYHVTAFGGDF